MEVSFLARLAREAGRGSSRHHHQHSSSTSFRHTQTIDLTSPAHFTSRQASLCLDFIIIGAGLAGLSTAYALVASGHRVQVLEQAHGLKYQPGGALLPPNATRILTHWGLENELAQKAATTTSASLIDLKTGRSLAQSESKWQAAVIEELGTSYYMMQHADLREMMFRLASSAGARVNFGVTVESVEAARETPPEGRKTKTSTPIAGPASHTLRPTVRLRTGEILHADVIIGADGRRSIVRRVVTDEDEEIISCGLSHYTGSIPTTEIRKFAPLNQLVDIGWLVWCGDSCSTTAYPVRQHQEFAVHVWWTDDTVPTGASMPDVTENWDTTTSLTSLRFKEGQMDPRLRYLLDKIGAVSRQPWCKIRFPEMWVDDTESIMLIGDAAHPQDIGALYGHSLALEDAALLGTLFSRLRSADQVPSLLYAYQELRKSRAKMLAGIEEHNANVAFSGASRIRDGLIRFNVIPTDAPGPPPGTGPTEAEFAEIAEVWGYFAIDAADECKGRCCRTWIFGHLVGFSFSQDYGSVLADLLVSGRARNRRTLTSYNTLVLS